MSIISHLRKKYFNGHTVFVRVGGVEWQTLQKEQVEIERLPAADVGGGGEEGEDEDDGVEEVPASETLL